MFREELTVPHAGCKRVNEVKEEEIAQGKKCPKMRKKRKEEKIPNGKNSIEVEAVE